MNDDQKIFRNIESRVKTKKSFNEKIFRKDYVNRWDLPKEESKVRALIASSLPDLIGFRITCFFQKDESTIYEYLKKYFNAGKFGKDIIIDFEENTRQANGHIIYKVTGKYKEEYGFEIQIKSVIHNLWGEVEHKTQYKTRSYDPNISVKKDITEQLFNILQAADKQLVSIFNEKYTADQLVYALFFQQTKEFVKEKTHTDILAKHYENFYSLFKSSEEVNKAIKRYIADKLVDQDYKKVDFVVKGVAGNEIINSVKEKISMKFIRYDIECVSYIFELLFNMDGFDDFIDKMVSNLYKTQYDSDFVDDIEDTDFIDEQEDDTESAKSMSEYMLEDLEKYFKVSK